MTREIPNKITPEFLQSEITDVEYRRLTGTMTHCTITVKNGFTFTGESACADPSNYDKELGEKFALENAKSKMWVPYGFLLKEQLADDAAWKADPYNALKQVTSAPMTREEYNDLRGWELPSDETGSLCDCGVIEFTSDDQAAHPIQKGDFVDFGTALHLMELGERMQRSGWNGKDMYIDYILPQEHKELTGNGSVAVRHAGYLALSTANGEVVPWTVSQSDVLATDWMLA